MRAERRLFRYDPAEREIVMRALRDALKVTPDVVFAYLFGSFAAGGPFRDVDVAVYLRATRSPDQEREHVDLRPMALSAELEAALRRDLAVDAAPIDVRTLNQAPLGFCYQALRSGYLLVSRDEAFRVAWVTRIVWQYLDRKPLRDRALKEAMGA